MEQKENGSPPVVRQRAKSCRRENKSDETKREDPKNIHHQQQQQQQEQERQTSRRFDSFLVISTQILSLQYIHQHNTFTTMDGLPHSLMAPAGGTILMLFGCFSAMSEMVK